jgi:thioredoxin-like negative regulator of GroEL
MSTLELNPKLVNMFIDIFLLGNQVQSHTDTGTIVRLIKQARPNEYNLAVIEGWQLIGAKDYVAARQLLEDADSANPEKPMFKALLAFCLMLQGESMWQSYAREVSELPPDEDALAVVRVLEELADSVPGSVSPQQLAMLMH